MFNDERSARWTFGAIGTGAFFGLLTLEALNSANGISFLGLLLEAMELLLMIAAAGGITLMFGRMHANHLEKVALIRDLQAARSEGADLRRQVRSHIDGLGAAIEQQFQRWGMTDAEREVGRLMLKGFNHKEIAALRKTSEATVRQQAASAYQRSGLGGRAAFCAFFLEDLLAAEEISTPPRAPLEESAATTQSASRPVTVRHFPPHPTNN